MPPLPVPNLDFYVTFAYFKLAMIAQTIIARHRQGLTVGLDVSGLSAVVEELIGTARFILAGRHRAL